MGRTRPIRQDVQRSLRLCSAALVLCSVAACSVRAQDVAEAARQEKARKAAAAAQQKSGKHVYSNDDLKRAKILTPEAQARIEARKKDPAAPASNQPAPSLDATNSNAAPAESLGEVARRFRREKTARESEQALKTSPRSGFPMNLSQPSLATPAPVRVPPVSVAAPSLKPNRPFVLATPSGRRDPFSRPSRIQPPPPAVSSAPSLSPRASISIPTTADPVVGPKKSAPIAAVPSRPSQTIAPKVIAPRSIAPVPMTIAPRLAPTLPTPSASKTIAPIASSTNITIQRGDSLWKLARQHLGKGARWPEFLAANPRLVEPNRIQPGSILVLPHASAPTEATSSLKISIVKGNSLWSIAKAHLGSGTSWPCLAAANPQLRDSTRIYAGQTLLVPASCNRKE